MGISFLYTRSSVSVMIRTICAILGSVGLNFSLFRLVNPHEELVEGE